MRALVAIRPFYGHFHPVAPVAGALREAGHAALFATERKFCDVIRQAGFEARAAGADPWDGEEFGVEATTRKTDDLVRIAEEWRPDVILRDPTDFGALVAAEALDLPHVTVGFSRFMPASFWSRAIGPVVEEVRRGRGLSADPSLERLFPRLYLDTVPPWFQRFDGAPPGVLRSIRPSTFEAPAPEGSLERGGFEEPAVLVTLGTVYNRRGELLGRLCRGAARSGRRVLCMVGPGMDAAACLGPQPSNVEAAQYVPFAEVMAGCGVLVSHGGYNSVLSALLNGVPVLTVPLGADHYFNAGRCVELGAGLRADPGALTEERVELLVRRLIEEPRFASAAASLAEETASLPDVRCAAELIEAVA